MVELRAVQKGSGPGSFAAIVGQEDLKKALLAVGANDALDGLLVRGEKGTAKSTAVRGLADLLPDQRAVADCPYGCPPDVLVNQCEDCRERSDLPVEERPVPLVTLPLGATRERVVGTLSVADAMDGEAEFDPGLLARANRGILYVDEVNLLDDHIVDVLLDAAASGRNRVERDGMSVTHPADFTLVGTMNPEEGDLRPQLRDRFAIQATVTSCDDLDDRVAIIEQALDGDQREYESESAEPAHRLRDARERLTDGAGVALPREFAERAAAICRDAGVDGHRGDIAVARTARTLAALDGRDRVLESDVERAAEFALPHRLRSRPFEESADLDDVLDDHFERDDGGEGDSERDGDEGDGTDDADGETDGDGGTGDENGAGRDDETDESDRGQGSDGGEPNPDGTNGEDPGERDDGDAAGDHSDGDGEPGQDTLAPSGASDGKPGDRGSIPSASGGSRDDGDGEERSSSEEPTDGTPLVPGQDRIGVGDASGPELSVDVDADAVTRSGSRASGEAGTAANGARIRTTRAGDGDAVDAAASVRAAAQRGSEAVSQRDLRASVRASDASALVVFAVDASASMRPAMRTAKGVVLELLEDAYQHRDEVAFVAFAGEDAEVLLPPTDSVTLAARHLKDLPTADRTPLPEGLRTATEVIGRADPDASVAVVVTDGRANVGDRPTAATRATARRLGQVSDEVLVVDAGEGGRAGLVDVVVEATDGSAVPVSALRATDVDGVVGTIRGEE